MPRGKKKTQAAKPVAATNAAAKFSAALMKIAERCNKFLAPKYDTANVRTYLNEARSQITLAATQAGQLAATWRPGRAKKTLTPEQIKKMKEKAQKLLDRAIEAEMEFTGEAQQ